MNIIHGDCFEEIKNLDKESATKLFGKPNALIVNEDEFSDHKEAWLNEMIPRYKDEFLSLLKDCKLLAFGYSDNHLIAIKKSNEDKEKLYIDYFNSWKQV